MPRGVKKKKVALETESEEESEEEEELPPLLMEEEVKFASRPVHTISLEQIISFCFPPKVEHPASRNRLQICATHGPLVHYHTYLQCLCSKCQAACRANRKTDKLAYGIFSGKRQFTVDDIPNLPWLCRNCKTHVRRLPHVPTGLRGSNVLSSREIETVVKQIDRDDILEAYDRKNKLSRHEETTFLARVMRDQKQQTHLHSNYRKDDVRALFAKFPKDDEGFMDFYAVHGFVTDIRKERVKQLRKMYPDITRKKPPKQQYSASTLTRDLLTSKVPDHQAFNLTTRLLSKHASSIAEAGDLNSSSLTQNVHLMRKQLYNSETNWKKYV